VTPPDRTSRPTVVLVNDVGMSAHHGSKLVTARFVEEFGARGFSVVTIPAGQKWTQHTHRIDGASLVVVNGEGTLHHSAPAAKELLGLAPYCQSRSIPVFLANSVWQDNSAFLAQQARSFTACFVRESHSATQLSEQRVSAQVVPDLVLGWRAPTDTTPRRSGTVITDSVILSDTQRLFALSRRVPEAIFTTLQPPPGSPENYTDHPFERLFCDTSTTLGDRLGRVKTRLFRARGALYSSTRRLLGHQRQFSVEDFCHTLSHTSLLITGRYHAVCLAMLTGTPFLAVESNSHKVEGMLRDAGLGHRIVSRDVLREAVAQPSTWTASDEAAVRKYVERARSAQTEMFTHMAQAAGWTGEPAP
jgi:hypothetical protein